MIRMFIFLMVAAVVMPAYAADSLDLSGVAKDIKEGKADVGTEYSMGFGTGRFHTIHTNVLGLTCETCHGGTEYQPDFILLRKYEADTSGSPGKVDQSSCLGCHKSGGIGTTLYTGRATK
ncbi:MAG: hypothetical protein OEM59_07770 [Rhodospirillales bacterium]|nr:hypothetical protein [Rhodospirillales bacterium]